MNKTLIVALVGAIAGIFVYSTFCPAALVATPGGSVAPAGAPARPPAPAPAASAPKQTDAQRRTDLENKLKSGVKANIDQAYAGYKAWIGEDGKTGEMHFYLARDLFAPLTDHTTQTMELINIARKHKMTVGPPDMAYAALAKMTDDSTAKAITRHVLLLLVADKPKDALNAAKQALAIAGEPKELAAANELIARCYKAQDGTIGRANGWIAANPK